jgi:glycosyltransferase involved in cell wall biosynthesis
MAQHTDVAPLVLHVFPTFAIGGAQSRFVALANRFGSDFRHLVVALDGDLAARERLSPALDVRFPAVAAPKDAMLANARRFRGLLREWRPDVLVTCNWGAIEFALANMLPVARHIHVEDGFGSEERGTQIRRRVLMRRLALWRSTVVLPSRTLERIAADIWRLKRVRYVPNGIDLGRFPVVHRPPRAEVTIGTVAGLRPEKNVGRLIDAFVRVAATRAVRLVIVGDGPERPALEAQAAASGIAGRVTFTGQRDDTPTLYAGFDVFALSSDTEQMPLSVLEAMASGLPVAATDVGDVGAMLDTLNAPFVTELDAHALSDALTALVDDPDLRVRLGAANRVRAERDFDQAVMAERWRALWDGTAPTP